MVETAVTDDQPSAPRQPATAIYLAVVAALERRIRSLGLTMQECDDLSGNEDGYTAKMLHPDTPSGRQAQSRTLQNLISALYRDDDFHLIIKPGPSRDPLLLKRLRRDRAGRGSILHRRHIDFLEMSRRGGLRSHEVRMAKHSAADRSRFARNAARARWSREQEAGHGS